MEPKITVIVPFYKVRKYFDKCLNSLVNQTLKDIEFILIDDCGNDGSLEIAKKYAANDSRIKIIKNPMNKGQGYSRNLGIETAKGEFVAFVDADDWCEPQMYEKLYEKITETNADMVTCNFRFIYGNRVETYPIESICSDFNKLYNVYDNPQKILGEYFISVWNALYKKEFLLKKDIRFIKTKFEDMLFCWQTRLNAEKIAFIPDVFYNYVKLNPDSDTQIRAYHGAFLENCRKLKTMVPNIDDINFALINLTLRMFSYTYDSASFFCKKMIFIDYSDFLRTFDVCMLDKFLNLCKPEYRTKYLFIGDYKSYNNKRLIDKLKRTIKYAIR